MYSTGPVSGIVQYKVQKNSAIMPSRALFLIFPGKGLFALEKLMSVLPLLKASHKLPRIVSKYWFRMSIVERVKTRDVMTGQY